MFQVPLAVSNAMLNDANRFLLGAVVIACAVIGLLFLRSWRRTHDRLFVYFALTFWLNGLAWTFLAFAKEDETRTSLYLLRLLAFALLLVGIWDKNRSRQG